MNKIIFVLTLISSFSAFAHIEEGTHTGVAADGQACSFVAGAQTFENNLPHPLNERIEVTVNGDKFVVHHPAVIDIAANKVHFNHDLFEGVLATPVGAKALIVTMVHTADFEGPSDFTLIENNWKTGEKKTLVCKGLKFN